MLKSSHMGGIVMKSAKTFFIVLAVVLALAAALTWYVRNEKEVSIFKVQVVTPQQMALEQKELGMDRAIVVRYWPTFTLGLLAVLSAGVAFIPQDSKPKA
jgi:ABC-type dipeptide/oligopeptide/nickel transport system permease component